MKTTKSKLLLISLVAVLVAGVAAWGQPKGPEGRFGPPGTGRGFGPAAGLLARPMAEKLGLSEEQRETIRGILEAEREAMRPWHEDLLELESAVDEAMHAEPFDEEAVRAAARTAADARVELTVARARVGNEVRQVLTPDQRETLGELRAERRQLRGHRGPHGRGHERRGPGS